jgi:maltooligosyltrehalose trehalohydrolase
MGQEYGEKSPFLYFVSHSDPELVAAVREGRKKEFTDFHLEGNYIDPQSVEAFNLSKINWDRRKEDKHQVLWQLYQKLITLRRTIPALKKLDKQNLTATAIESDRVILLHRWQEQSQIFSILNFSDRDLKLSNIIPKGKWEKILDSADLKWMGNGSDLPQQIDTEQELSIKAHSFVVYQQ